MQKYETFPRTTEKIEISSIDNRKGLRRSIYAGNGTRAPQMNGEPCSLKATLKNKP